MLPWTVMAHGATPTGTGQTAGNAPSGRPFALPREEPK